MKAAQFTMKAAQFTMKAAQFTMTGCSVHDDRLLSSRCPVENFSVFNNLFFLNDDFDQQKINMYFY